MAGNRQHSGGMGLKPVTAAAIARTEEFVAACDLELSRLRAVALSVLVWGPSLKSRAPIAMKRKEVQAMLKELGHAAMTSEELPGVTAHPFVSQKTLEYAQALKAEVILIFVEGSPGALAELHDFVSDERIAPKILLFAPEDYREGYSGQGAAADLEDAYGGVVWYQPEDVTQCNLLTKAIKRVEGRRRMKFYNIKGLEG